MLAKRILLGVTGGIAAYKITFLVRLLKKSGSEVRCVMTPSAKDFVSPLVLATLSGNKVHIDFWDKASGEWANHVELGLWADVFLIAPATANTLAKMANGISDNLLLTTYFSMKCNTIVAPAMDLDMYRHPTVLRNLKVLEKDNVIIIPSTEGELASGLHGLGRMEEPEALFEHLQKTVETQHFNRLKIGTKVLITAGPTYEKIDPVRFIGNHSSGKMGVELAKVCLLKGYEVILVMGPSNLNLIHPSLQMVRVETADQMLDKVQMYWKESQIGIFAAAVADYKAQTTSNEKIKKTADHLNLKLIKNPDILMWASEHKKKDQITIGFALETNNSKENALSKLKRKNLDAIVLNSLENEGAGFKHDTNKISILDRHNNEYHFDLKSKTEVAHDIIAYLEKIK